MCVDKTGTLTLNRITVCQLIVDEQTHTLDAQPLPEKFHTLAEFAVLAPPIDPFDPMDKAFKELGEKYLSDTEHLHAEWELVHEYPLSEKLLALSHVWRSRDGGRYVIAAKGAPEAIADLCHFNASRLAVVTAQVEKAAASGLRVLAVAGADFNADDPLPAQQHDFDFRYLGLVGLVDPVRAGVADAVAECRGAGIRTTMITGDYPGTALEIGREIGLDHKAGCITGHELDTLVDDELASRASAYSRAWSPSRSFDSFARCRPLAKSSG